MINRFRSFRAVLLLAAPLLFTACKKDDDNPPPAAARPMYVVNQGKFNNGEAAITRFDRQSGAVVRDQFAAANPGVALGDVAQSMTVVGDKGYIVVNNSNKIVVVQMSDLKQVAEITGFELPRYLAVYNGKGYVTEYVSYTASGGRVTEIDLTTNARTSRTFAVGLLPEQLVATAGGQLLVTNGGANTVSVIDLAANLITERTVGDSPAHVQLDNRGRAWVLCGGMIAYTPSFDIDTANSTVGALATFDPATSAAPTVLPFNRKGSAPGALARNADGTKLLYTYHGNTFEISTSATTLPRTALIPRSFDALGIDPADGTIYGADVNAYTADGTVRRYRPTGGAAIDQFSTAVGPTQFVF